MSSGLRVSNIFVFNSIVNSASNELKFDANLPYTYTDWLGKIQLNNINKDLLFYYYNQYLLDWNKTISLKQNEVVNVKDVYIQLLKEISINYTNDEEKRFISNIDFNNARDIAIVIPFYARKLKQICIYYQEQREKIKKSVNKYNLVGAENIVKIEMRHLIFDVLNKNNIDLSNVDLYIKIEELYTLSDKFFNNEDATFANKYPTLAIQSQVFLSLIDGKTIADLKTALKAVKPDSEVTYLDYMYAFNDNDFYYIDTTTQEVKQLSQANFISGKNLLNQDVPTLAVEYPDDQVLFTEKQIGGFFTPKYLGVLFFNSFDLSYSIDKTKISSDGIYIFPNPKFLQNKKYNGEEIPVIWVSSTDILRVSNANSYKFGQVLLNEFYNIYYGYNSKSQSLGQIDSGLNIELKDYDFFTGEVNDIFKGVTLNGYIDTDTLAKTIIDGKDTIVNYNEDIFGNLYGLSKDTGDIRGQTENAVFDYITLINTDSHNLISSQENLEKSGGTLTQGVLLPQVGSVEYNSVIGNTGYFYIFCADLGISNFGYVGSAILDSAKNKSTPLEGYSPISYDLYKNKYELLGQNLYFKNSIGTKIGELFEIYPDIINKHKPEVAFELRDNVINFTVINDCFIFETTNFIVVDVITFDSSTNDIKVSTVNPIVITKRSWLIDTNYVVDESDDFINESDDLEMFVVANPTLQNPNIVFEDASSYWYDELENSIYFVTIKYYNNAPVHILYKLDLSLFKLSKIFNGITNITPFEFPIIEGVTFVAIEKPIITKQDNNIAVLTSYVDALGFKYIVEYRYKYSNNKLELIFNELYYPFNDSSYYRLSTTNGVISPDITVLTYNNMDGNSIQGLITPVITSNSIVLD